MELDRAISGCYIQLVSHESLLSDFFRILPNLPAVFLTRFCKMLNKNFLSNKKTCSILLDRAGNALQMGKKDENLFSGFYGNRNNFIFKYCHLYVRDSLASP